MSQVTYRVIQVSDGQLEGQTDGGAAVSLVAGFPATSQTVTQVERPRRRDALRDTVAKVQFRQREVDQPLRGVLLQRSKRVRWKDAELATPSLMWSVWKGCCVSPL